MSRSTALDVVAYQNDIIGQLLERWRDAERRLAQDEDVVDSNWARGSAVKLLLLHMAVREAARVEVADRLRAIGESGLADRFDGDGERRRTAISRLETELRGVRAINANTPDLLQAADGLAQVWLDESAVDKQELLPAADISLGPPGQRGLPSAGDVRASSAVHPAPNESWYYRVPPLKHLVAAYQYFSYTSTDDLLSPAVRDLADHTPGRR